ncbi:hypothetical protein [Neobacillus kokaensis]|uniref:hypothetical protein n=1 Tax=Neobacillus kokaensis TaxID=2759023 RepID=UPI00174D656B|nr:hypothetical protein [Neobacillus kokaensis]
MALKEKKENITEQGSMYEGRDAAYMDIDRMINEGMSGGSVHMRHDTTNIEEARDLTEEEPPYEAE